MNLTTRSVRQLFVYLLLFTLLWFGPATSPVLARVASPTPSTQRYFDEVAKRVTQFRLDNGMTFIVLERHQAPVVSFLTYVNVGGTNEPNGQTGVAHYLEHLAFKGTERIGTKNYALEKPLLDRLDRLFDQIQTAKAQNQTATVTKLQTEFEQVQAQAANYIRQNELSQIVEQSGGVGMNAATSADETRYFYSFPANKLELWMSLESERFLEPVFREFYQEKDVILEERRTRTENSPVGQLTEAFLKTAFRVHPYGRPVIGSSQDIQNLRQQNVQDFFEKYYIPGQIAIAIVGDVNPKQVKELATAYFGRYPARPTPPAVTAVEPPQTQPREVTLKLNSQPWYLEGYHIPSLNDPNSVVYELISRLLSDGRTSRLYTSLIEKQQVALSADAHSGFPGDKYPNLMMFIAQSAPGRTLEEVATALHAEIERLKTEPIAQTELERIQKQVQVDLLKALDSNMGMARLLLEYEVKTGRWQNLFQDLERIRSVTALDIQSVAKASFTPQNRTVGRILPK
jgi:predicted Zn-dependent peptidase